MNPSRISDAIKELRYGRYRVRPSVSRRQTAALYCAWMEMQKDVRALAAAGQIDKARSHARVMRHLMSAFSDRGEQRFRATQPAHRAYTQRQA